MDLVTDHVITDYTYYGLKIIKNEKKDDNCYSLTCSVGFFQVIYLIFIL